jgi:hypothetical protein
MRRFALVLSVVTLALLGVLATRDSIGRAQSAAPGASATEHPVVGAWWTANDAPGPGVNTAYGVFHADGTYLEVDPNIGVGVGVWQATGERSADLTYVFQDIDPEPGTTAPGTVTVRQSVTVDDTENAFTAPLTVEVQIPDGTVVFAAAYTARGIRLGVEPMAPLGTPVTGTPAMGTPTG